MRYRNDYGRFGGYGWRPYVPVAARRRQAEREMQKLQKKGHPVSPVVLAGRTIARTFWGKAWCDNLERYSDYANRLPRGRTYVRNGSVVDLQIGPGEVKARVSGSELYSVAVKVSTVPKAQWTSICTDCAGAIDSLVELLQGRFSKAVTERICQQKTGLFPAPSEIEFSCSCPDWASMCKHVAAVLYGIGARLDDRPELLFALRKVDEKDLIAKAGKGIPLSKKGPAADKVLAADDLAAVFGLDMSASTEEPTPVGAPAPKKAARGRRVATPRSEPTPVEAPAPRRANAATKSARTKKPTVTAKSGPKTGLKTASRKPKTAKS